MHYKILSKTKKRRLTLVNKIINKNVEIIKQDILSLVKDQKSLAKKFNQLSEETQTFYNMAKTSSGNISKSPSLKINYLLNNLYFSRGCLELSLNSINNLEKLAEKNIALDDQRDQFIASFIKQQTKGQIIKAKIKLSKKCNSKLLESIQTTEFEELKGVLIALGEE